MLAPAPLAGPLLALGPLRAHRVDRALPGLGLRGRPRRAGDRRRLGLDLHEAVSVIYLHKERNQRTRMGDVHGHDTLDRLAEEVVSGRMDPDAAADELQAAEPPRRELGSQPSEDQPIRVGDRRETEDRPPSTLVVQHERPALARAQFSVTTK